jgi:hypothetical protein
MIAKLLTDFAALFEPTHPQEQRDRRHWLLLLAILVAGAVLRLWGLGDAGLHGDEETMAMPTMHIIAHGSPLLPSGMFYSRAVAQLYLMAGSVALFGESEWALRLPSVICGVLLIYLAYRLGRRFLAPAWNLAFAAAVAFLPAFIEEAQTARMYVFLMASVTGFAILVFEWERTNRVGYLLAAVALLLLGIHFHTLAVFAAFLTLFPGLLHGDLRRLAYGIGAFVVILGGFFMIDAWIASNYWETAQVDGIRDIINGPRASTSIPQAAGWMLALAAAIAAGLATFVVRPLTSSGVRWAVGALFVLGLLAQVMFSGHLALLLYTAALIVAWRNGGTPVARLAVLVVVSAALAAAQVLQLYGNGVESLRQILGAMAGRPSVWPLLVAATYSVAAGLLVATAIVVALWRMAHRQRIPDHLLFVALGVWLPLVLIGLFAWDIPPRYAGTQIMPLLLSGVAAAQWLFTDVLARRRAVAQPASLRVGTGALTAGAAALACLLVVNPVALGKSVALGARALPDHKGAAEYIESVHLQPNDIILAEDVLQQTYYLGQVDYWLVTKQVASKFVYESNGELRDFYTNTRLIGTGEQLQELIDRRDRGAIYVIGSGENQEDGRRYMRSDGIYEVLASPRFKLMFTGRDGLTQVWKVPAPDTVRQSNVAGLEHR